MRQTELVVMVASEANTVRGKKKKRKWKDTGNDFRALEIDQRQVTR